MTTSAPRYPELPEDLEQLLADYLGGELDPDQRARFEQRLAQDASLAHLTEELRHAQSLIASVEPGADVPPGPSLGRRVASWGVFRAAAVLLLAFVAGFVARGLTTLDRGGSGDSEGGPTALAVSDRDDAVIRSLRVAHSDSDLARSLSVFAALAQGPMDQSGTK